MPPRICSVGGHFNPLKSYLLYISWGHGSDFQRYKLRFCGTHLSSVEQDLSEFEVSSENGTLSGGDAAIANCLSCGKPLDEVRWYLFATCYPTQNERKDYWASLHVDCRLPTLLQKNIYAE